MKKTKEDSLHEIPLRITDTTLRDGHQSLWATRMRTEDIMKIIDVIDNVGYYSLEVWGGATFDVCMRFLRENPWERLRLIKSKTPKTPLQMLLRGQNVVGYKNYSDDVVDRFVALACENGMDIFRVFDALNDPRNLESAIRAVKKYGGHAQGTLSYTISPFHTIEKFVEAAKAQLALGIDSLCIKDMAGILSPISVEKLVSALVKELKIPIQLHCHASSGMAYATYVEGVRAGAGAIDCAICSLAGFSGQPPVESFVAIFKETNYSADLDVDALRKIDKYFKDLAPKRMKNPGYRYVIDPEILVHQIPGGMISNFRSQLEQQGALDKLPQALEEVSKVRKDLGYPPLVTPTSQIVGTQSVMNVLAGERYKMVPNEVKQYLRGYYGRPPAKVDPEFVKKILGDEKPIDHRPADNIEPMLPKATDNVDPKLIQGEEDIVSYCILPEPALEYFKWRSMPEGERPPSPADLEIKKMEEDEKAVTQAPPKPVVKKKTVIEKVLSPEDYKGMSTLLKGAKGIELNELTVRKGEFVMTLSAGDDGSAVQKAAKPAAPVKEQAAEAAEAPVEEVEEEVAAEESAGDYDKTINAPFVGTFYRSSGAGQKNFAEEGDTVGEGQPVCIVEAMKLFNEIKAPEGCKIVKFLVESGDHVEKGQPMIAVE